MTDHGGVGDDEIPNVDRSEDIMVARIVFRKGHLKPVLNWYENKRGVEVRFAF